MLYTSAAVTASDDVGIICHSVAPGNSSDVRPFNIPHSNDGGDDDDDDDDGDFLTSNLGPQRQPLGIAVSMTAAYGVIFFTGLIGNVFTCVVIVRHPYMRTVTNFYLANLAASDLLMLLLGLPLETFTFWSAYPWIFGESFCVIRTVAAETATYVSILTITAFTIERYVAICHPMWSRQNKHGSLQRATRIVTGIWIASGVCSVPIDLQYGVVYLLDRCNGRSIPESATCNIRPDRYSRQAFEISTFLFFFTPMVVISALYGRIVVTIRRSMLIRAYSDLFRPSALAPELRMQQHQTVAHGAVIKMLVAVVVAFLICWAPFHTQRLMTFYIPADIAPSPLLDTLTNVLYYVSGLLYYVSTVINPILYNIMSLKFRQAFKSIVFCPCKQDQRRSRSYITCRYYCSRPPVVLGDTKLTV